MKYSKKQYEEKRAEGSIMYRQVKMLAEQAKAIREAGIEELTDIIRTHPNSTAEAISELTEGEFSAQAIGAFGHYAEWGESPSIPDLSRVENIRVRHYAEVDDNGNIIPGGARKDVKSSYYTYSIKC